ncbi:hypothetical protein ACAN107058_13760 [Paracidovorax anthurii]
MNADALRQLARRPRPFRQQAIEGRHLRLARGARREHPHLVLQGLRCLTAQAHRLAQIAHPAAAAHLRQRLRRRARRGVVGELAVEVVARQQQTARDLRHPARALAAVRACEAAAPGLRVAVAQVDAALGALDVDAGDAQVRQRVQLARLAHPVLVRVLPDAQLPIDRIGGIDHAVAVAVLRRQGLVAVGVVQALARLRLRVPQRLVAEQLLAGVDQAVAVAVQHHQPVVALDPARGVLGAVAVVVEEDGAGGVDTHRLDAVAVQVQDQRVARGDPVAGLDILGISGFGDSTWNSPEIEIRYPWRKIGYFSLDHLLLDQ